MKETYKLLSSLNRHSCGDEATEKTVTTGLVPKALSVSSGTVGNVKSQSPPKKFWAGSEMCALASSLDGQEVFSVQ